MPKPDSSPGARRWDIFVVSGSHFDFGWCGTPAECLARGDAIIKDAVDAITGNSPDFHFTIEYAAFLDHFLRTHPGYTDTVRLLLAQGSLEVGASWVGMMDQILDGENAVRDIVLAKWWAAENLGVRPRTAQLSDCPGRTRQLPQILAKCDVSHLAYSRYAPPQLCHWLAAPDGSRVLAANHCHDLGSYGWGFVLRRGLEEAEAKLPAQMVRLAACWTPPQVLMGDESDLIFPYPRICEVIEKWNAAHDDIRLRSSTITQFFEAVETDELPTYDGEYPYAFYKIPAFQPRVYAAARHAENALAAAEQLNVLRAGFGLGRVPQDEIDAAWLRFSYCHDHNIGGWNGEFNDAIRLGKVLEAQNVADEVIQEATSAISEELDDPRDGEPVVVFNTLSWPRSDLVLGEVVLQGQRLDDLALTDADGGSIPHQVIRTFHTDAYGGATRLHFLFVAPDVPPLGYKAFYATAPDSAGRSEGPNAQHPPHASLTASPDCLANSDWTIRFRDGAIASVEWHDERINADGDMPFGALFALGDDAIDIEEHFTGERWEMAYDADGVQVIEGGPVRATVELRGRLLGCPITQRLSLYEGLPRLDIATTIDWQGERNRQVRMNLAADMPDGKITYETPFGHCMFGEDEVEGSYRGTGGRFVQKWVDVSSLAMGVTLATRHCAHAFDSPFDGDAGASVYPILLNTTYSCGDHFLWYENEGRHTFEMSLIAHAYGWRDSCSFRHGWEFNRPLLVADTCFWHPRTGGPWSPTKVGERGALPASASLFEVDCPNVVVTAVKQPRAGKGIIVRLFEVIGDSVQVELKFPCDIAAAEEVNLLEEHIADIPPTGNLVSFPVSAYGIHTLRIVPAT